MLLIMNGTNTIKEKARIRVKPSQMKMIVETMEQNPFLNEVKISGKYSAAKRSEDWEELVQKLNIIGGPIKSVRSWQKCWTDKKCEVKKKMITADRKDEELKLTPLEKRIILLIAPERREGLEKPSLNKSESNSEVQECVIPKIVGVHNELAASQSSESCNAIATSQSFNETNSEQHLLSDTTSHIPDTEESHQAESLPSQLNTSEIRLRSLRKRHVDLKAKDCSASPAEKPNIVSSTIPTLSNESNQTDPQKSPQPDSQSHLPNTEEFCLPQSFLPCVNLKVEDCLASPVENSIVTSAILTFGQEYNQTVSEGSLQPDPQSRLHDAIESCQPQSFLSSQSEIPESGPRLKRSRTKTLVLKSDNAQKLVDSQTKMATALTRCATALEKRNEIQERALEIAKRKVDVQERLLKIKKEKTDAFIGILNTLKDKF